MRRLRWEEAPGGRVTVLRPKLGTGRLGRWLSGRLVRPYCRVRLDEHGSFVWSQCDGRRTLREIADALQARSSDPAEDWAARVSLFVRHLERQGMIGWSDDRPGALGALAPRRVAPGNGRDSRAGDVA